MSTDVKTRRCVVFLQNAWSPVYAGHKWPRPSWLAALKGCTSGRRLARVFFDMPDVEVWYDNTTPEVSAEPSGICAPDLDHMKRVINEQQPDFVLACGKQAMDCISKVWDGYTIVMPHPAYRFVTNDLLAHVRTAILNPFGYNVVIRPAKPGERSPTDRVLTSQFLPPT